MVTTRGTGGRLVVTDVDPETRQLLRELAVRFRVRQARVLEKALERCEWVWATHDGLPDDFTKPRDW